MLSVRAENASIHTELNRTDADQRRMEKGLTLEMIWCGKVQLDWHLTTHLKNNHICSVPGTLYSSTRMCQMNLCQQKPEPFPYNDDVFKIHVTRRLSEVWWLMTVMIAIARWGASHRVRSMTSYYSTRYRYEYMFRRRATPNSELRAPTSRIMQCVTAPRGGVLLLLQVWKYYKYEYILTT